MRATKPTPTERPFDWCRTCTPDKQSRTHQRCTRSFLTMGGQTRACGCPFGHEQDGAAK